MRAPDEEHHSLGNIYVRTWDKIPEASRLSLIEWAQTWNEYVFSSEEEHWKLSDRLEGWLSHTFMPRYCPSNFAKAVLFSGIYYLIYICQFQWCKHQMASLEPPVWFHWSWNPEELGTVCAWGLTPTCSNPTVQVPLQISIRWGLRITTSKLPGNIDIIHLIIL